MNGNFTGAKIYRWKEDECKITFLRWYTIIMQDELLGIEAIPQLV